MKKLLTIIIGISLCTALVSCEGCSPCKEKGKESMELIEKDFNCNYEIWRDSETGCEYFVRRTGHGVALIQLTDREGRPKITD